ncbi:MAG: hypothetical protein ACXWKO_10050, partial [Phenylobacterium sp.]
MGRKLAVLASAGIAATAASAQPAQKVTGPVAVYWMSAATQSGFGMPGASGGRPSAGDIMKMMRGGGGANHTLTLQLGSSQAPQGEPHADHLPPAALAAGDSLPLLTPKPVATPVQEEEPERPQIPREYQRPKGKMMIFWGCGEHAGPGQPVVIDFAQMTPEKMQAGQMPAGMMALAHAIAPAMRPPSPSRNKTYGDWPNSESRTSVSPQSSLVGDHTVRGDYSPEIRFNLKPDQDFLGPLTLTTNAKLPSGAVQLGWSSVPNAQAYIASFMGAGGGRDDPTIVMWVSSETQAAGFALPDYISNPEITKLVANRTLMGAEATSCAVPKEAVDAGRQGLVQMVAYGREANFAFPERPKDPKIPWNIAWEVKVRYRSATGGMLGQPMP